MKASEIMTKDVVTVRPDMSVKEIAGLMAQRRISGVPVVDGAGRLIGIVSETDLLHRIEVGTERRRKWWLGALASADDLAREYAKSHGLKAADIMSTSVISVDATDELGQVADLLRRKRLKRVPVVRDGRLVGIITRGDLVRAFAEATAAVAEAPKDDDALTRLVTQRINAVAWLNPAFVSIVAQDGVVEINGMVPSSEQRRALRILVEETPGVARVADNVRVGTVPMSA